MTSDKDAVDDFRGADRPAAARKAPAPEGFQRQFEDDLAMAERHVREAEVRVERQRRVVLRLRSRGITAKLSEELLDQFEDTLAHHRVQLERLRRAVR